MNSLDFIKNRGFIKLITFVVITAMLCQNVVWAGDFYRYKDKLAPASRWSTYGKDSKHGLTDTQILGISYSVEKIKKHLEVDTLAPKTLREINQELDTLGCDMFVSKPENNVYPLAKAKQARREAQETINLPYFVFYFDKENPEERLVLFNLEPQQLDESGLKEIGLMEKDKHWLEVPGTEGVWIADKEFSQRVLYGDKQIQRQGQNVIYSDFSDTIACPPVGTEKFPPLNLN